MRRSICPRVGSIGAFGKGKAHDGGAEGGNQRVGVPGQELWPIKGNPDRDLGQQKREIVPEDHLNQRRHAAEEPDPAPADGLENAAARQAHDREHDADRKAQYHGDECQQKRHAQARQDSRVQHVLGNHGPLHVLVGNKYLQEDNRKDR
jgi:hypothetical protein